jgi:hypothetical protein
MTSTLLPIIPPIYDVLFDFAQSDGFWANLQMAFGTSYDVVKATELRNQWQSRNFSQLPEIEVVNSSVLGSANGAYGISTNKIYLSESFGSSRLCVIIFAYGIVKCLSGKTFRAILRIFYQYRPRFHT